MAKRLFDITSWYNNEATFPDLTITLDDGQQIEVHKAIVFQENKYFKEKYARESVSSIFLTAPPAAVELLVRTIYGYPVPEAADLSWLAWIDASRVAQNYCYPFLVVQARKNFMTLALAETGVDEIRNMIKVLGEQAYHSLRSLVVELRQQHAMILLDDKIYLSAVDSDPALMKLHFDDLLAKLKKANEAT